MLKDEGVDEEYEEIIKMLEKKIEEFGKDKWIRVLTDKINNTQQELTQTKEQEADQTKKMRASQSTNLISETYWWI